MACIGALYILLVPLSCLRGWRCRRTVSIEQVALRRRLRRNRQGSLVFVVCTPFNALTPPPSRRLDYLVVCDHQFIWSPTELHPSRTCIWKHHGFLSQADDSGCPIAEHYQRSFVLVEYRPTEIKQAQQSYGSLMETCPIVLHSL
jgi:hypothetical protein